MERLRLAKMDNTLNRTGISPFQQQLMFAQQRVEQLNQFRFQQALAHQSSAFGQVFCLLPFLLHYNLPTLPGYVVGAPKGIAQFQPNQQQQHWLGETFLANLSQEELSSFAFDGLYAMGSTGSITQTSRSDLDLWLCHSHPFDEISRTILKQKLANIKQWAMDLGVEINFFLMNPAEFKAKKYTSGVTKEHNGSAQHFFLLDEFYRSAIRLAGKPVLWLHLADDRASYQALIQQGCDCGALDLNDWIDFGDFSSLSANEFFGASLWQLYKGTQNPYKSAIKILLLESYSQTYPKTNLISKQFKQRLLGSEEVNFHFDPYLEMLCLVTEYLTQSKEFVRLDRLRQCFYIKSVEGQDSAQRLSELNTLAKTWGWSAEEIALLQQRPQWKIKQATSHQQMLVEHLLHSYRNLIQFARKFQLNPSIMPQDIDMIMRKLYLEFEFQPSKTFLIHPKIASNLSETAVTFLEVSESQCNKIGWYLINHAPLKPYDSAKRHVQYQPHLVELIAWAYFNRVITAQTEVYVMSKHLQLDTLRQFITDLRLSFPCQAPTISGDELYHPHEIRNLIVAVNLASSCTPSPTNQARKAISQMDLLDLSAMEGELISSISLIYRNMWNEIFTRHFEGEGALLKALKFISNKIYRNSAPPHSVNVFSYGRSLNEELRLAVLNLVNRCITVQTGAIYQRQNLPARGKRWISIFNPSHEGYLEGLQGGENRQYFVNETTQSVPKAVYNFASEGFLQFFFEDKPNGRFNVYILDKENHTECYFDCLGRKEEAIKQIGRFYSQHLQGEGTESFNFPQFYQLLITENTTAIVPFQSKQHRDFLTQHAF
ncbi:adenylate cyclase [Pasteurellaceae bacterium Macca]|nr:adenylate cyclase [Pasteurellaceae bacterium Macca]